MAQLNFPDPNSTTTYTAAGITWTWNPTMQVWSSEADDSSGGGGGGIPEAPTDGQQYARQSEAWTVVQGEVEEAPTDGQQYARQNETWTVVQGGDNNTTINYNGAAAWGEVNPDGTKAGAGLNFTSTLRAGTTGIYDIVFDTPMPNADYSLQTTALATTDVTAVAGGKTATGFIVRTWREGVGLTNIGFTFTVHASNALPPRGGTGADAWAEVGSDASIRGSYNMATCTNTTTGTYAFTFTTPMPSNFYSVTANATSGDGNRNITIGARTTDGFTVYIKNFASSNLENGAFQVVVHATNAQLPDTITQEELDAALNSPGVSAWGAVDEAGGKIGSGLNFSTSTLSTNPGVYQVTFVTPMPSNQYSVTATPLRNDPGARYCTTGDLTTTGFTVRCFREVGLINSGFHFAVHATNAPPPKGGTGADAWATVLGTGDLSGGFNIASTTQVSTGVYELTFTSPMPSADYAVVASSLTVGENFCGISNKTTTSFRVNINSITGDPIDRVFHAVVHATNAQLPNTVTQEQIDNALSNSCAAWGSVANTGAILDSLNIASTSKDTDGTYTVTFATPMPNANYAVTADVVQTSAQPSAINFKNKTATGFEVIIRKVNDESLIDKAFTFAVFATNAPAPKGGTGADAWAQTTGSGAGANLRTSFNIASVTNDNPGEYLYTFTTPMPSSRYSAVATINGTGGDRKISVFNQTETGFTVSTRNIDGDLTSIAHSVIIHATNAQLPAPLTQDDLLFVDGRNASTGTQEFQDGIECDGWHC